jgi:hypothetical protein
MDKGCEEEAAGRVFGLHGLIRKVLLKERFGYGILT